MTTPVGAQGMGTFSPRPFALADSGAAFAAETAVAADLAGASGRTARARVPLRARVHAGRGVRRTRRGDVRRLVARPDDDARVLGDTDVLPARIAGRSARGRRALDPAGRRHGGGSGGVRQRSGRQRRNARDRRPRDMSVRAALRARFAGRTFDGAQRRAGVRGGTRRPAGDARRRRTARTAMAGRTAARARRTGATVVVGPVRALLPAGAPRYLRAYRDHELPSWPDGASLRDGWSGNFLLDLRRFERMALSFDPALNRRAAKIRCSSSKSSRRAA